MKNSLSRSEQRTVSKTHNNRLTGKAPYKSIANPTGLKPARNTPGSLGLCSQPPAMPDATRPVIPARPGASAMASERSCRTRGRIANRRPPLRGDHCIKKPSGCRLPLAHHRSAEPGLLVLDAGHTATGRGGLSTGGGGIGLGGSSIGGR